MKLLNFNNSRVYFFILAVIAIMFIAGCTSSNTGSSDDLGTKSSNQDVNWKDIVLTDVNSGQTFKISDFAGKNILLETFAVWCPTCTKQQQEIQKMRKQEQDDIIHISLDIDPNEGDLKVKSHAQRNGFDWKYVVAPRDMTQKLLDDFGLTIVNAPSAPVILICEDQSTRFLKTGVKSAEELFDEVAKGCNL